MNNQYKRILLKLSGESLMGEKQYGIDEKRIAEYATQIKEIADMGIEIGIVIGGGNIFRGLSGTSKGVAIEAMQNGTVAIISGGTGNPFFTTDTGSALRGIEIEAEVMLKGTRVDGIYTADPEKDPTAKKFDKISYDEIYTRGLKVMDLTATTLCKENHLPIIVFDMDTVGNLKKVLSGENIGTLVY